MLEVLGLPGTAAVDLRLRDQHAVEHVALIARAVEGLLADDSHGAAEGSLADDSHGAAGRPSGEASGRRGTVVYVPAYEGGHPDHDAVNLAAAFAAAARPSLRVVEFSLYRRGPFGLAVQPPSRAAGTSLERYAVLPLSDEDLALRRALARANASQLAPSLLPLLALPAHDYTRPAHPGRLLYELYTPWRFPRWSAAATRSSTSPPG